MLCTGADEACQARRSVIVCLTFAPGTAIGSFTNNPVQVLVLRVLTDDVTHVANTSEFTAFVASSDSLAGVFQYEKIVFLRDGHDGVHVARCTPHVNRGDCSGTWSDGIVDGLRGNRHRFVDVDDYRDSTSGNHGDRGRHVGVGRY